MLSDNGTILKYIISHCIVDISDPLQEAKCQEEHP